MNETSTELSIATQINELHAQAEALAKSAKDKANEAITAALECGRLLTKHKKQMKYGDFKDWVETNCNFARATAYRYMQLTRKLRIDEDDSEVVSHVRQLESAQAKTLRQAYIATGILPDVPKLEKEPLGNQFPHVKHIDAVVLWYRKLNETNPAKNWTPHVRDVVINDLAPLMEIYNELIDLQESMAR